jgi:hypothetical protein
MRLGTHCVMAGLVPAIHVLKQATEDVDAGHKAGHDRLEVLDSPASAARGEK